MYFFVNFLLYILWSDQKKMLRTAIIQKHNKIKNQNNKNLIKLGSG